MLLSIYKDAGQSVLVYYGLQEVLHAIVRVFRACWTTGRTPHYVQVIWGLRGWSSDRALPRAEPTTFLGLWSFPQSLTKSSFRGRRNYIFHRGKERGIELLRRQEHSLDVGRATRNVRERRTTDEGTATLVREWGSECGWNGARGGGRCEAGRLLPARGRAWLTLRMWEPLDSLRSLLRPLDPCPAPLPPSVLRLAPSNPCPASCLTASTPAVLQASGSILCRALSKLRDPSGTSSRVLPELLDPCWLHLLLPPPTPMLSSTKIIIVLIFFGRAFNRIQPWAASHGPSISDKEFVWPTCDLTAERWTWATRRSKRFMLMSSCSSLALLKTDDSRLLLVWTIILLVPLKLRLFADRTINDHYRKLNCGPWSGNVDQHLTPKFVLWTSYKCYAEYVHIDMPIRITRLKWQD